MIIDNPSFYEPDDKLKTGKINLDKIRKNEGIIMSIQLNDLRGCLNEIPVILEH